MLKVPSSQIHNEPIPHSAWSSHSSAYFSMKGESLGVFKFSQPAINGNYNNKNKRNDGFEVSMVVTKTTVFWEVTLHYVVYVLKYSKGLRTVFIWVITQ